MNDKDFYRIARYIAVLTFEHYNTQAFLADKFNIVSPPTMTMEQVLKKVCDDFGLPYKAVLEHSESAKNENNSM